MKVLILAVQLLFSTYDYSFEHGTDAVIEAVGFSLNEAYCTTTPDETIPSCIAYCYTNLEWVGLDDLMPVCKEVLETRGSMHYKILKEVK